MTMQGQGAYRGAQACARCGAGIDPTQAAYAAEGMICRGCEAQESLRDANAGSLGSQSGLGPLGWGIVSLFCNVLFIPSILAITSGIKDLKALKVLEKDSVGGQYGNIQAKAVIGIVLGCLHPLMVVGVVCLVALGAIVGALDQPAYDPYDPYSGGYYDTNYGNDPLYDPYAPAGNTYDDSYNGGLGNGGLGNGGLGNGYQDPYAPAGSGYRDPYAPAGNAGNDPYAPAGNDPYR